RGDEFALSQVEFVVDDFHVALQLLIDIVGLCQPLRPRLIGLLHSGLCRLLEAPGLIQCAPAHSQADQRNATQNRYCQSDPAGCPDGVHIGGILEFAHRSSSLLWAHRPVLWKRASLPPNGPLTSITK